VNAQDRQALAFNGYIRVLEFKTEWEYWQE